ncbi:hypothetical protein DERP_004959 [Dermatophagoides pteronyssinus]|uniref:Uncharacterized protein n=1 Tax=Dermatophagoides pteronyssinus TaxID=6956 RepID=A0ABQ8JTW9_DERPT|nr:hypothetical protein DERP_004959 [Dermatophagoides pteronyssinus]
MYTFVYSHMDALQYQQVIKIMADNRHGRFVDHSNSDDLLYWFQKQQTFLTEPGATHIGITDNDDIFIIRDSYACIDLYDRKQINAWSTTNDINENDNDDLRLPIQTIPIVRQIKVITYQYVKPIKQHSSLSYLALLIEKKQTVRRRQILIYTNFPSKNCSNYEHFRPAGICRNIKKDIDFIETNIIIEDDEYSDLRTIACCPNDGHIAIGLANEPKILIYELIVVDQHQSIIDFIKMKLIQISFIADIIRFNSGYCAFLSCNHVQIICIKEFKRNSKHEDTIINDKQIYYNNLMVKSGQHEIYGSMMPKACPFKIYSEGNLNKSNYCHVYCRTFTTSSSLSMDSIPLNRPIHHSSSLIDVKNYSNNNDKNLQYLSYQIEMETIDNDIIIVYILWNDHIWVHAICSHRDPLRLIPISIISFNGRFVNCFAINLRHDVIYVLSNDSLSIYVSHVHNFVTKFQSNTTNPFIKRMFLIGKNQFFGAQSIILGATFVLLACMPSTDISTIYLLDKPTIRSIQDCCRHSIRQINISENHENHEDVPVPLKILAEICWNPTTIKKQPYDRSLIDRLIGQTIRRIVSITNDDILILRRKVLARLLNLLTDSMYCPLINSFVDEYFKNFITNDDKMMNVERSKTNTKLPIIDPKNVIVDHHCFHYFSAIPTTMLIDVENDTLPLYTNELNRNDRIYQFYYYLFGLIRFNLQFHQLSSSINNDLNYCKQLFAELRYEIERQFL